MEALDPPVSVSGAPGANDPPREVTVFRVLYLFSGAKRKASVKAYLSKLAKQFNIKVYVEEVDILRSKRRFDLRPSVRRRAYLQAIAEGKCDFVLASPPCGSFSRARFSSSPGPPPLRLRHCPRGFPWLTGRNKEAVTQGNLWTDFSLDAFEKQFSRNASAGGLLEQPESLGRVSSGVVPGTLWDFNRVGSILNMAGVRWGALSQSSFGTPYPKPTRLLGRLRGLHEFTYIGDPQFDEKDVYIGPIPSGPRAPAMVIGRDGDSFRTSATAAYPPKMCAALAKAIVDHLRLSDNAVLKKGGVEAEAGATGEQDTIGQDTIINEVKATGVKDIPINMVISECLVEGLPPPPPTTRRPIEKAELELLRCGRSGEVPGVYIGRGGGGVGPSPWANPFKIGRDGTRDQVIAKYKQYIVDTGLSRRVRELRGSVLLCHCARDLPCHGDHLVELAEARAPDFGPGSTDVPSQVKYVQVPENHGDLESYLEDHAGAVSGPPPGSFGPPAPTTSSRSGAGARLGSGPPRFAEFMGSSKPFADGGGLCSPGRWHPDRRPPAVPALVPLRELLYAEFMGIISSTSIGCSSDLEFVLRLAAGKFKESPFTEEFLHPARCSVASHLGLPLSATKAASGQSLRLDLIKEILTKAGDPDAGFFDMLKVGVPLGVDGAMPRTPQVYEEKVRWKLGDVDRPGEPERENYRSIVGHEAAVKELFEAEEQEGWMKRYTNKQAKELFGENLFVAALAVVQEPGKIRVVHDGSNAVNVNHRIKPKDQVRSPGAGELRRILREQSSSGARLFGIAGDVSKGHRRVKVRASDWGFQACRLDLEHIWVNCVGTYGMASAAYWWARASGGAMIRLPHYLLGAELLLELLVYVDDFILLARTQAQVKAAGFLVFLLSLLGVPFSWKKFRGGTELSWIGYWSDFRAFRLGVSQARADWVVKWIQGRLDEGRVDINDFTAVLGRLCFAMGPLEYARPFLAPLYAWVGALDARGSVPLPWSVRFILTYIKGEFMGENRTMQIYPMSVDFGPAFRADAKAEGQSVVIGGWDCAGGRPAAQARWFSIELDRRSAPWAFARGEPFRTIAALELYASLMCIVVFADAWPEHARGGMTLSGITDNLGNTYCVSRLMTSKFPSVVILTELAAQLKQRKLDLSLGWVPRDQNEEADALTNQDYSAFDMNLRVDVAPGKIKWILLPRMLAVAEELYEQVRRLRSEVSAGAPGASSARGSTRPEDKLRARDPW